MQRTSLSSCGINSFQKPSRFLFDVDCRFLVTRPAVIDIVGVLDENIRSMLVEHAANGLLRSGNTIKRTMDFIAQGNEALYQAIIDHLQSLDIAYYPAIEADIQAMAGGAQEYFKSESLPWFQKSTEHAGNPSLYESMLPDLESSMAADLAKFQNTLNATVVQLKLNRQISPVAKALWGLEAILLLASMFIAGMWYKDPNGNYEPILVGLGIAIPLIALGIKLGANKVN